MTHLVGDLVNYLKFDDIDIDNWHFKLYYKGATFLFMTGSMVGVLSSYFGDPIECDFQGVDAEVASDYCWIHGSSYIPVEYQPHMKCIADLEGVRSEDDAPDTSYYQWVVFMMAIQAGLFYVPHRIWCMFENGLLESFGKEAKSSVMMTRDNHVEGEENVPLMEQILERYVKCFRGILHHNQWYLFKFLFCEFLNVTILFLNFYATDVFLQGRFWYYGIDVIKYYSLPRNQRKMIVSPFCAAFPTEVSCTVPNIGAAGGEQHHNGMCVLSQNIINRKIYLVLWWYLVAMVIISIIFVIYRLSTLLFPPLRFAILYGMCGHKYDEEVSKSLRYVLSKCYIGDWFVLYQLGKNVNLYFLREFIKELKQELREKPKRSRSLNSKAGSLHKVKMQNANDVATPKDNTSLLENHNP